MYVVGGTASKTVAEELSNELHCPLVETIGKRFPDDECYVRVIGDISQEHVVIIQTAYPDHNIVELFLLQNAVKEAGAARITVVMPYMGYARQDTKFKEGEPISAQTIARLVSTQADNVITVDPHKEYILDFFTVPARSCSAVTELAKYLKRRSVDFILAPDKGALERAKRTAAIIGCEYDYMEKKRIDGTTVEIKPKKLDAKGKTVAIIDDIISTGGTMAKSIQQLNQQGANSVFVACTHGLFAGEAIKKLRAAGCTEIIATNTIVSDFSKVSITPCIAQLLSDK